MVEFTGGGGKVRIFDVFGRGLKKGKDVDVGGGSGHSRGIWEKVRNGSDCGFGWFGSGFLRRAVIGGIYCGWNLLTVCMLSQLRF